RCQLSPSRRSDSRFEASCCLSLSRQSPHCLDHLAKQPSSTPPEPAWRGHHAFAYVVPEPGGTDANDGRRFNVAQEAVSMYIGGHVDLPIVPLSVAQLLECCQAERVARAGR